MKILTIFLLSVLVFPSTLFSQEVSVKEAQKVAKNFFYKNAKFNKSKEYKTLELKLSHVEAEEQNLFYVFEIANQDGFVITSAQSFAKPILGYSDQHNVDFTNLSPELGFMLDYYKKQIQYGIKNKIKANSKVAVMWKNLKTASQNRTSVTESVGPLLLTTWNQAPYYNDMCPTNSSGEHAVSGCVAVAMSQIMKFYDYPKQGSGNHSHGDYSGTVFHSSNINYANQTYEWGNMPTALDEPNEEVAKLMYHCGQTVNMDWEVEGSGAMSANIEWALKDYFKYSSSTQLVSKDDYSNEAWEQLIRNEMDAKRPVVFAGVASGSNVGHAWNCDGYQSDDNGNYLYHMNYGWGGFGNGYFALNNLSAGSLPGGDPDYFDSSFRIIKGIKPESNYPAHCSEERTITGTNGVFGDGSGNENYENNLDCRTIIEPTCQNGVVDVYFERIDLAEGDVIKIYGGISESDPVIAEIDINSLPEQNTHYISNASGMLIRFITDGENTAAGWDMSYSSSACDEAYLYEGSGSISDGSASCDYEPSVNCYWYIEPENASQITLSFSEFNLDDNHDYLKIYKNTEQTANLVMKLKGTEVPSEDIVIDAERVILKFKSFSEENVGTGWALDYSSDVVGINPISSQEENAVKIYPNPFNEDAVINIENPNKKGVVITLMNTIGQTIASKRFEQTESKIAINLSEINPEKMEQGIYFLNVRIGEKVQTHKLISE